MKGMALVAAGMAVALLLAGCATPPPGVERGPKGTIAYDVAVESSPPGARIEVNGQIVGNAPMHLKVFGDLNGKFYDFGWDYFVVRALPVATNQFVQARLFHTGHGLSSKDLIPARIEFDMTKPSPVYLAVWPPPAAYVYPYGPPVYWYPPPYYYGPRVYYYHGPYWRHW